MRISGGDLKDAIAYTAQVTGFQEQLIEKDYYCSVILEELYKDPEIAKHLVFKGGTLLSKSYAEFFRLSEDLDFSVVNEHCRTRTVRSAFSRKLKSMFSGLEKLGFKMVSAFQGFNESTQYNAILQYDSVIEPSGVIKLDVGFRNDLINTPTQTSLKTILLDPFSNSKVFLDFKCQSMRLEEAYSEKVRAALMRDPPAIRDFFDIWIAKELNILPKENDFLALVAQKIVLDKKSQIDLSFSKMKNLEKQIETELNPVLIERDANRFSLEDAWNIVTEIHNSLGTT